MHFNSKRIYYITFSAWVGLAYLNAGTVKTTPVKPMEYPVKEELNAFGFPLKYTFSNGAEVIFRYDEIGRVRKRIMPDGSIVSWQYEKNLLVTKNNESRITKYEYDDYDRLIKKTITQGDRTLIESRKYDSKGNLVNISEKPGTAIDFLYDRFGRKLAETGKAGSIKFLYDDFGRLITRQVQIRGDSKKFQTNFRYNGGWIAQVYSSAGRFCFSCDFRKKRLNYIEYYSSKGKKSGSQLVFNIKNQYNKAGLATSKTFTYKKEKPLLIGGYQYNQSKQIIGETSFGTKWMYRYNKYSQIVSAKNNNGQQYDYLYDNVGNCIRYGALAFTYNNMWQVSDPGYHYDVFGNLVESPGCKYRYDLKNRLISLSTKDETMSFQYDPLNQLVGCLLRDNASGVEVRTDFIMSGMIEYARSINGDAVYHTFTPNVIDLINGVKNPFRLLASTRIGRGSVYFISGLDGSIVAGLDSATNGVLKERLYSPFGWMISPGIDKTWAMGFKLMPVMGNSLYFYNGRFYSTKMCGFLTRGNEIYIKSNPYAFENCNPVGVRLAYQALENIDSDINRYRNIKLKPSPVFITK